MATIILLGNIFLGGGLQVATGHYPFSSFAFFAKPVGTQRSSYELMTLINGREVLIPEVYASSEWKESPRALLWWETQELGREVRDGRLATSTLESIKSLLPPVYSSITLYYDQSDPIAAFMGGERDMKKIQTLNLRSI